MAASVSELRLSPETVTQRSQSPAPRKAEPRVNGGRRQTLEDRGNLTSGMRPVDLEPPREYSEQCADRVLGQNLEWDGRARTPVGGDALEVRARQRDQLR